MEHISKLFSFSMLFSFLVGSSISAMESPQNTIPFSDLDKNNITLAFSSELVRPDHLDEKVNLFYDKDGFFVHNEKGITRVHSYDTDQLLRGRKPTEIIGFASMGKFKISKFNNGEYAVRAHCDIKGGGAGGATAGFLTGKFIVHLITQGFIIGTSAVVSVVATPAAGVAVGIAMEKTVAPLVEVASNVIGLGCGIIGGVATGPV